MAALIVELNRVHVDEPLPAVHMSLRDKNALFCASAVREALAQAAPAAAAAERGSQRSALLDMGRGGGAGEDAGARLRLRVRWQPDGVVADGERRPRAVSLRAKLEYWPEHGEEQETPGDAAWSWASALLQPDALAVTARVAVCSGELIGLRRGAAAEAAAPQQQQQQQQQQPQQQQCVDRVHGLLRYMRTLPAGAYLAKRAEGAPRVVIFRDVAGAVCASGAEAPQERPPLSPAARQCRPCASCSRGHIELETCLPWVTTSGSGTNPSARNGTFTCGEQSSGGGGSSR